jgi:transposase
VFTLGDSRKSVRLLTFASSSRRWAELHDETFRRLGGAVRVVVLDNLKEGVLTPDVYDPTLNPLYRDVLAHYGAVALPCRVGAPDRQGNIQGAVSRTTDPLMMIARYRQKLPLNTTAHRTSEESGSSKTISESLNMPGLKSG